MGCTPSEHLNPLIPQTKNQLISTIKTCPDEYLLHFLYQYIEVNSLIFYQDWLDNFRRKVKEIQSKYQEGEAQGKEKSKEEGVGKARERHINYHMDEVLKYIKCSDQIIKKMEEEANGVKKNVIEKKQDWMSSCQTILKNKSNKKIQSTIKMKQESRHVTFDSSFKQSQKDEQKQNKKQQSKIMQCKQRIEQCLKQQTVEKDLKNDLVMTQVRQLQKIIQKNKNQTKYLNQQVATLQKELQNSITLSNQSLSKFTKDFLQKQKKIKQSFQKELNKNNEQKQKLQIYCRQLTKKMQQISQLHNEKQSPQIQQISSIKNIDKATNIHHLKTCDVEMNTQPQPQQQQQQKQQIQQTKKRNSALSLAQSQVFKKFSKSRIVFQQSNSYANGTKIRQIIDQIFSPIKIISSRLLYTFDKIRPNNMNSYIQKQQNLLMIGLLGNGVIVGAFSCLGFKESTEKMVENYCFIFSIQPHSKSESKNEQKSSPSFYKLQLKEQNLAKYSFKLDRQYLKIGENQLRITCSKPEISINILTPCSMFTSPCSSSRPKSIQQFLFLTNYPIPSSISNPTSSSSNNIYMLSQCQIYQLQVYIPEELKKKCENVGFTSQICEMGR